MYITVVLLQFFSDLAPLNMFLAGVQGIIGVSQDTAVACHDLLNRSDIDAQCSKYLGAMCVNVLPD